jgi:hypothetical protein
MLVAGLIGLVSLLSPAPVHVAAPPGAAELRRPLHLPKLKRGARCPLSPSRLWPPDTGQRLNGRGPAFLVGVGHADPATINMIFSYPDEKGWYGQKTPWAIRRDYEGPMLVRAARIDRRGKVRFAYGYGQHLPELYWEAGADQGLPPDPSYRFLASETLVRSRGCYAFQVDGTSFSSVIVMRVRG